MTTAAKYVAAMAVQIHTDETKSAQHGQKDALDALSIRLAMDHADRVHPRAKLNSKLIPYPIWSFEDFGQFGKGVMLYFTLLKKLMLVFAMMLILALPQIGFSVYFSSGVYDSIRIEQSMLSSFAVGNTSSVGIPYVNQIINKEAVGAFVSTLDLAAILFFTFYIRNLQKTLEKEADITDQLEITASDYTIRVRNIPKNLTNRFELLDFFQERWGKVVDVVIAFNDSDLVQLYLQRGRLKHEEMKTQKLKKSPEQIAGELVKISERILKLDGKIEALQANSRRVAVDAFVLFNSQASRDACLIKYPNTWLSQTLMPQSLRFRGHRIVVTKAPEPSNILFENLKYSAFSIQIRRTITLVVTVALMAFSLVIIYKASETQRRIVLANDVSKCSGRTLPTRDQALEGLEVSCYCYSLSSADLQAQTDLCGEWAQDYSMGNVISILIGLVIALVNAILKSSILQMASFEKHSTLSAKQRAITVKLFIGLVINTGIIILLVNGDLSVIGLGTLFHGSYNDFSLQWYNDVGVSVFFTMVFNTINPHIIPVLMIPARRIYVNFLKSRVTTQKDLNELFTGPVFAISDRYATLLNTIFVTLLYSPGIPLLLVLAAVTFGFIFLFDKIALLRLYRIPPMFDESLALYSVNIIRYAILMHTGMAVWFYSNPDILPSYNLLSSDDTEMSTLNSLGLNVNFLLHRVRVVNSASLLILFFIQFGQIFVSEFVRTIECCRRRSPRISPMERAADDNVEYLIALRSGIKLESYHMHDHPRYIDAFMRTASLRQLQPTEDLSVELSQAKLGKAGKKKKKRESSNSAITKESGTNSAKFTEQQQIEKAEPGAEIGGQSGHKRQTTENFMDERGIITVQCPSCAKISNVLWMNNGKASQRFTCPYCGTIFAVLS